MKAKARICIAVIFLLLAIAGIVLAARLSSQTATTAGGKLPVVAAENFWGDIAGQIGGQYVSVTSIVTDPNVDPHLYESSARDAASLARARIIISNGLGYDDFIDKLNRASRTKAAQLKVSDVLGINGDNPNPHIWYDIPRIPAVANAIAEAFSRADPAHNTAYQANAKAFVTSLEPLNRTIDAIKQSAAGAPVTYTERVAGYVLQNCALNVVSPNGFAKAIEDDADPSAADTQAFNEVLTNRQARALIYNSQVTSDVTKAIQQTALQSYVPIVGFTETLPPKEKNYQSWQLHQLQALQKALR